MRYLPVTIILLTAFLSSPLLAREVKDLCPPQHLDNGGALTGRLSAGCEKMSKEKKALYLNLVASAGVLTHGVLVWDSSPTNTPKARSEGWFGADTSYGGADKLGHFYTGYLVGDLFNHAYEAWGFDRHGSGVLSFLSSAVFTSLIEVADAFSDYGLSYEDIIADISGAAAGYVLHRYPWLSDKIDLRLEYKPRGTFVSSTDYDHMKYLVVLKAEGFDWIKNEQLKFVELHLGYYTRGFVNNEPSRERTLYLGIGFNLSRFFRNKNKPLSMLFSYYQMPYSYLEATKIMTSRH